MRANDCTRLDKYQMDCLDRGLKRPCASCVDYEVYGTAYYFDVRIRIQDEDVVHTPETALHNLRGALELAEAEHIQVVKVI